MRISSDGEMGNQRQCRRLLVFLLRKKKMAAEEAEKKKEEWIKKKMTGSGDVAIAERIGKMTTVSSAAHAGFLFRIFDGSYDMEKQLPPKKWAGIYIFIYLFTAIYCYQVKPKTQSGKSALATKESIIIHPSSNGTSKKKFFFLDEWKTCVSSCTAWEWWAVM